MIDDIRIKLDFLRHPKTRTLRRALGADGVLSLVELWLYTAANKPDGMLGKSTSEIEAAADWPGEPGAFVSELCRRGWLDKSGDGIFSVHGWADHQPWITGSDRRRRAAIEAAKTRWSKSHNRKRLMRGASGPHTGGNAPDQTKTTTKTQKETTRAREARLVARLAEVSGTKPNASAVRAVARIVKAGKADEVEAALDRYARVIEIEETERRYRIKPHNLVGRAARWQEFDDDRVKQAEEDARPKKRGRLFRGEDRAPRLPGVERQSTETVFDIRPDDPPHFQWRSSRWLRLVDATVDHAQEIGVDVDRVGRRTFVESCYRALRLVSESKVPSSDPVVIAPDGWVPSEKLVASAFDIVVERTTAAIGSIPQRAEKGE